MTFYNRFIQFITLSVVCWLAYKVYELQFRIENLETRPILVVNTPMQSQEEEDEEDEARIMTYEPEKSEDKHKLLTPDEFEPSLTPSKLKKLKVAELSQIAQEKNIGLTDSEGKRLNKTSLINKITSTLDKDD